MPKVQLIAVLDAYHLSLMYHFLHHTLVHNACADVIRGFPDSPDCLFPASAFHGASPDPGEFSSHIRFCVHLMATFADLILID